MYEIKRIDGVCYEEEENFERACYIADRLAEDIGCIFNVFEVRNDDAVHMALPYGDDDDEDDYDGCDPYEDFYGDQDDDYDDYDEPYDLFDEVGYDPYSGGYDPDL